MIVKTANKAILQLKKASGCSSKYEKFAEEIVEILGIKESTVRFHNRNIYSKLSVGSLKQLLLYASVMKSEEGESDSNDD